MIQYSIKQVYFVVVALQPCILLRVWSIFVQNNLKCLCMNKLH